MKHNLQLGVHVNDVNDFFKVDDVNDVNAL
jgi:hypothetical protein